MDIGMDQLFYTGPESLIRVAVSAPLIYFAVIVFIRISGKRSTSQMNNFDWIVTVAMGSLVASGIVSRDVGVLDVWLAIALLLGLQFLVTKAIIHSETVANLVKANPTLLVQNGRFLDEPMRAERISEREISAAIRSEGLRDISDVLVVMLENDGTFSVIRRRDDDEQTGAPRRGIAGWPDQED